MRQQPPNEPNIRRLSLDNLRNLRRGNNLLLSQTVRLEYFGEITLSEQQYQACLLKISSMINNPDDPFVLRVITIIHKHKGNVSKIIEECGYERRQVLHGFLRQLESLWRQICYDYFLVNGGFDTNPKIVDRKHSILRTTAYKINQQIINRDRHEKIEIQFKTSEALLGLDLLNLLGIPSFKVPLEKRQEIIALIEGGVNNTEFIISLYNLSTAFISTVYHSYRKLFTAAVIQENSILNIMIMLRERTAVILGFDDDLINSDEEVGDEEQ